MSLLGRIIELSNNRGFAKICSIENDNVTAVIFHSIARQEKINCSFEDICLGYLAKQTRVYCKSDTGYRVGRVVDFLDEQHNGVVYTVRFPNSREGDIKEQDIYVRPWESPEDAISIFAVNGGESQYLYDRRQPFAKAVRELKNATYGLESIISANVELVEHQITAVQRILSDPIQRYLLADEVGMGKTIEAGLVVKQHLIDNPNASVGVCVPDHLLEQWNSELLHKLGMSGQSENILIFPHDDIEFYNEAYDVLIIDEAHKVVDSSNNLNADELTCICASASVLLLLTATPPMSDYRRFFKMLQLLDPEEYSETDFENFRRKVDERVGVGRHLLSLSTTSSPSVLRFRAKKLIEDFSEDELIVSLSKKLMDACNDDPERVAAVTKDLQTTIAEKYRLSQRIIRSRRSDTQGWEFQPRAPGNDTLNRTHIRIEEVTDPVVDSLFALIEEWRLLAFSHVEQNPALKIDVLSRLRELLELASSDPEQLSAAVNDFPVYFAGERELLHEMQDRQSRVDLNIKINLAISTTENLLRVLVKDHKSPVIIIFAPNLRTRKRLVKAYNARFNDYVIIDPDLIEQDYECFETKIQNPKLPTILVLDPEHEEGMNLSIADAIIHYELTFDVSKLEQRIGRVDRFGRKKSPAKHRLLIPTDAENSTWSAWCDVLVDGFQIFNRSVNDVQYLTSEIVNEFFDYILNHGTHDIDQFINQTLERIEIARREQDEQSALDNLSQRNQSNNPLIKSLDAVEENEEALGRTCESWIFDTLGLYKKLPKYPDQDFFQIMKSQKTLLPLSPWVENIEAHNDQVLTWKRGKASIRKKVDIFRPGNLLFDEIVKYTNWDDRGRVYATYKSIKNWSQDAVTFFKIDLLVTPSFELSNLLNPSIAERAMLRKLHSYFQNFEKTIILDLSCKQVEDHTLVGFLNEPYNQKLDINLSSRPDLFNEFLDLNSLKVVGQSMFNSARQILRNNSDLDAMQRLALARVKADIKSFDIIMSKRNLARDHIIKQRDFLQTAHDALANLHFSADGFGCIVVGPERKKNV